MRVRLGGFGLSRLSLLAGVGLALALGIPAASADDLHAYQDAVRQAHALVIQGERQHDPGAGRAAADVLAGPVGDSQPEILADLRRQPPDLADADNRLTALETALESPADASDPARASRELHRILALPRYDAMRASPSPIDTAAAWLIQRVLDFLAGLGFGGGGRAIIGLLLLAFVVAALVIAAVVLRDAQIRRRHRLAAGAASARQLAADRFADADRRAAAGDYVGALRALAGGVSAALGGEEAWEVSPLTVRELFRRADRPDALRPLLLPFEAAVYGHRVPDATIYAGAATAAAPYRAARP